MTKKILIDASITEETRLVILQGQRIEVFETEAQNEIKGNIYLARVTRVEPSLQAAFVEYGGNRQGFLGFLEIHTDYFQIPTADRAESEMPLETAEVQNIETKNLNEEPNDLLADLLPEEQQYKFYNDIENKSQDTADDYMTETAASQKAKPNSTGDGGNIYKKYNIQEVVKRGQLLLIQVVKEERGNKGAALTTFLSLAGRYCVLMPNTQSSGGVSRKIDSGARSKIRSIVDSLEVPDGMSLIVRTAGAQQLKPDIERDFEYLTRLWESVRELTLKSTAPALVYEEGKLVQRALRDLVKKDVHEIYVEGKEAYLKAKKYMEQLMPNQLEILNEHKEAQPIFSYYEIEQLLEDMHQPTVQLKSGGYIVINPTEALVAVDVNSGKATSEHNIEDTAFKTNLEAAEEIARQARLRDLAGLIVVDFIDMEKTANVREVEKRMRTAVRTDRARVQIGRISQNFGLLEISRQRLRPELSEGRTETCSQCFGSGQVPTPKTIALRALREGIAFASTAGKNRETVLRLNWPVVLYLLNEHKDELIRIEQEHNINLRIEAGGLDNPNKPWALETRKLAPNTNVSNKEKEAVSMETAYTKMEPPPPTEEGKTSGEGRKHRNRSRNNRNRQNKRSVPQQHGGNRHKNKKVNKTSGTKTSLWRRILGKA